MDDPFPVHPPYCHGEFSKQTPRLALEHPPAFDEIVEQFPSGAQLGHQPDVALRRDDLVKVNDVQVMQSAVVMNLPRERRSVRFGDLLHRASGTGEAMYRQVNRPKSALTSARILETSTHLHQ